MFCILHGLSNIEPTARSIFVNPAYTWRFCHRIRGWEISCNLVPLTNPLRDNHRIEGRACVKDWLWWFV